MTKIERNTKERYSLPVLKDIAFEYLAGEFGFGGALDMVDRLPTDDNGHVLLCHLTLYRPINNRPWTKRDLTAFIGHIKMILAYHQGKAGKPLRAGSGCLHITDSGV